MTQDQITQIMANIFVSGIMLSVLVTWILIQIGYLTWENPIQHLKYIEIGRIMDSDILDGPPSLPTQRRQPTRYRSSNRSRPRKRPVAIKSPVVAIDSTLEQECVMAMKAVGIPTKVGTVRRDLKSNPHITSVEDYIREKFKR